MRLVKSSAADVLIGHLVLMATVSVLVWVGVEWLTSWPAGVALWLSGLAGGLVTSLIVRAWLSALLRTDRTYRVKGRR
ncbi:hypothetical protein D5H75_40255 [Bailinhaonella thermotolerans]|uniref:Uncharacterized protein n=1 Tax=Bailinhaonella thermotolerans TaxID=1070861 RepID=A0A3A4AKZ7_9ACTN|nr:hypothetical protein D5H75_40255 [Bailinhaonella thermotolerans]